MIGWTFSCFALVFLVQSLTGASPASAANVVVGSIPGSFDVTQGGSANYGMPLKIAPGSAGTEPKIQLVYDSQVIGGPLGAGWSIAGLSVITRGPKDQFVDGVAGGIKLEDSDALYLDGQRLVPVAPATGSGMKRSIEFRKVIDDQSRIVQIGPDLSHSYFKVQTKGGLTIIFGNPDNPYFGTPGFNGIVDATVRFSDSSVLAFAASAAVDSAGNYIEFHYELKNNGDYNGDYNVTHIDYTGHGVLDDDDKIVTDRKPFASINFSYENAPRPLEVFVAGRSIVKNRRLVEIVSCVFDRPLGPGSACASAIAATTAKRTSRYLLEYTNTDTANRFVLDRVRMFGEDDSSELPATNFTYERPEIGWLASPYEFPSSVVLAAQERLSAGYRFAHLNTSGTALDLLFSVQVAGKLESFAFQNNGVGTWTPGNSPWTERPDFRPPIPFASSAGDDLGVIVADVTGDGRVDLLQNNVTANQQSKNTFYRGN
jgi:Salmonella virulence plasmid 65kDa B protein